MSTPYHARYFAHELTRQHAVGEPERLSMALFDACVDLNPHQIDAAAFALRNPLSKGVLMADEVGLGKTIEAGLVLCQYWAERKRKLLVICPASLRKQWSMELLEKFNLPNIILDSQIHRQLKSRGEENPFASKQVVITSLNFAARMRVDIRSVPFDLVVIDEAHKLRNAYRPSNKMGQHIKWALEDRRKLLLTATPLQNTLFELFGLATVLDDTIFGDINLFRAQYAANSSGSEALRGRLAHFCQRTLRRQVTAYINYTNRRPLTFRFRPTHDEHQLEFGERLRDVNFTKGKTSFVLPVPAELQPVLRACIGERTEGPLFRSRRAFEGKQVVEMIPSFDHLLRRYEADLLSQPAESVQAEHDRKVLFRALLRRLGGVTEDAMNKEFKKLLAQIGVKNGATLYTLRSSVTTAMHRANLPHLEMRYLTGHTTNDILNEYTSLDPVGAMQRYFDSIRPLLTAISERAQTLELGPR